MRAKTRENMMYVKKIIFRTLIDVIVNMVNI